MGKIILAPKLENTQGPLVYLLGPISPTHDWQSDAMIYFRSNPRIDIVSPRWSSESGIPETEEERIMHQEWETHFLQKAFTQGIVFLWLSENFGSEVVSTLLKIGMILERKKSQSFHLVLGIDPTCSNHAALEYFFHIECPEVKIHNSLEGACEYALSLFRPQ